MSLQLALFAASLGLLLAGSHALLKGSINIARRLAIPSFWIGFVLVAIGTSLPELVVSLIASWQAQSNLVLATIIGSNAANIGLILALGLFIHPFRYSPASVKEYAYSMLFAVILLGVLAMDGFLSRGDGLLLLLTGLWMLGSSWRRLTSTQPQQKTAHTRSLLIDASWATGGILALWVGGHFLIEATVELARLWSVSGELLALSLIAVGTSLPELITTIMAASKHQTDVALGNILGSNTVNIFFILGLALLLHPLIVPATILHFDLPVILLLTSVTAWLLLRKKTLHAREGFILLLMWSLSLGVGSWLRI